MACVANVVSIEYEIPWLSGYENSSPVRIGNAASNQFQLDVYGEVLAAIWQADRAGIKMTEPDWALMVALMEFLESHWQEPDEGIWEVRGGRQHFTHSKMMAWLAFDRAIKLVEDCDSAANEHFDRWQKIRDQIHAQVCERGYNPKKKAFTQVYGSDALDASLLTMPLVGFLPVTDERVRGTIEAIERELMVDGLLLRYRPQEEGVDGLPGTEGSISSLLVLAGGLFASARSKKGSARFVRAPAGSAQRPWVALGRIRSTYKAAAGKFSSSIFARCVGKLCPNFGRRRPDP